MKFVTLEEMIILFPLMRTLDLGLDHLVSKLRLTNRKPRRKRSKKRRKRKTQSTFSSVLLKVLISEVKFIY